MISNKFSLYFNFKLINNYKVFKRRKKKRRRGKHLYSLFLSRKKKYSLYYQPFDSKLVYKGFESHKNFHKNNIAKKNFKIGLKSYKSKLLRIISLKSLKFVSQRNLRSLYIDKYFKFNISTFPDYWLTSKPKSVRMGKGKGELKFKVFFLKRGLNIYNFRYITKYSNFMINKKVFIFKFNLFILFLLKILKGKLSLKSIIYKKLF